MIVTLLYEPNTPGERDAQHLSEQLNNVRIEHQLIDAESVEGIAEAELYDLVRRPSVVVSQMDGTLIRKWQGKLPTLEDISYSAHS